MKSDRVERFRKLAGSEIPMPREMAQNTNNGLGRGMGESINRAEWVETPVG